MSRPVRALPAVPGPELYAALRAALKGTGPALLPLPADPAEQARVRGALRPDLPEPDEEVALLVPTSGSTGEPKGVLLTAACLTASATAAEQRLGGPAAWLLALPLTHIGGLQVLLRALLAGGEPVVTTDLVAGTAALPPGRRHTSLVPTQLRRALADPAATAALATFTTILLGGAAAPPALLAQARAAGLRVVTTYGMSETSGGCVYDGVPLPGVTVRLGDPGGYGRISLQGPVVARGYRLRPDLTEQSFAGDTYATDDVGRWDGDRLAVLGRADDLVVTGGENVAPAAVEAALAGLPAVADAVVVGVPDAEWGARVVAHVVLREGATLPLEQAREHVGAVLGRRSAPRELRVHAALPLLPSGKPDRAALRSTT